MRVSTSTCHTSSRLWLRSRVSRPRWPAARHAPLHFLILQQKHLRRTERDIPKNAPVLITTSIDDGMKTSYQFSNLLGSVYSGGNVVFTPDGQSILSPVGNRLSIFNLVRNTSTTLPFQTRKPIARVALNPSDHNLVLVADEDGRALLANISTRSVIASVHFKKPLRAAQFSNDGKYFAISHGSQIQVWKVPRGAGRQFNPFELHRIYTGHSDDVLSISWSRDSSFFLTTSKDHTCKLYSLDPIALPPNPNSLGSGPSTRKFRPKTFSGHRAPVVAAFWSQDEREIYTVSRDGACFVWKGKEILRDQDEDDDDDAVDSEDDDREATAVQITRAAMENGQLTESVARIATTRWGLLKRNYFSRPEVRVTCTSFHPESALLVVGFSDGVFGLWTMPSFDSIHTLSISNSNISSVSLNSTGEWLAFGAAGLGQLLVWEWQSESYILKQQGHYYDMNAVAYTADGAVAATGGDDGKVKLWNLESGFCIATFSEHTAPISSLEFSKSGAGVLFSASLDGTVRAWDLLRFRNFRTFTSPSPCQFGSLAVESNGEIICAGGTADGSFGVYLWNVQTGKLLDVLDGHEGPVSSMMFSPNGSGMLATTSWDKTFRVWEIFKRTATAEPVSLSSEGLALAFRPDGMEVCIATLDGQLAFFDPRTAKQTSVIECRRDIAGGRGVDDKVSRNANAGGTAFTTLAYTADGSALLAGGNANFVCLYSIAERVLLNRWQLSLDLTLDGTQDRLDSRRLTEAGAAELLDVIANEDEMTPQERIDRSLPGAQSGDLSKRTIRRKARTKCIRFNPTGRSFSAATTLGLLVYSLDAPGTLAEETFDPMELEIDLTPASIRSAMQKGDSLLSFLGALRLNETGLLREVYESIAIDEAPLILTRLPTIEKYLPSILRLISLQLKSSSTTSNSSPHLEFSLLFLSHLLSIHGQTIMKNINKAEFATSSRLLQSSLNELRKGVKKHSQDNFIGTVWIVDQIQRKEDGIKRGKEVELERMQLDL